MLYYAYYQMALAHQILENHSEWISTMLLAYATRPTRGEALWRIIYFYRGNQQPELAMLFASYASGISYPSNDYFQIEHPVYQCAIREELAISGYRVHDSRWLAMGRAACFGLSADPFCPAHGRVALGLQIFYSPPLKVKKQTRKHAHTHTYTHKTQLHICMHAHTHTRTRIMPLR